MAVNPSLRDASPGDLVKRVLGDLGIVVRAEVELAKLELVAESKRAAGRLAIVVAGAVAGLFALGLASATIVSALGLVIAPLWIRLLIMTALFAAGSGILVRRGLLRLRETNLAPEQAIEEAEETVAALQGVKERNPHEQ